MIGPAGFMQAPKAPVSEDENAFPFATIKTELRVGDEVRLKKRVTYFKSEIEDRNNVKAAITAFLEDVEGGIYLKDGLRGCRYWNIKDVVRA